MILFTGASGFLGKNIISILSQQHGLDTLGLMPVDTIFSDLSRDIPELKKSYDIVLHAAGKAHSFCDSDKEKELYFKINLEGTKNLCLALEKTKLPSSFIFISTVAVYGIEEGCEIDENYPLKGFSPYALSKIYAEDFLNNWCNKNNVKLSILRPSLIAGKNPPGNLGAMVRGISKGKYLRIGDGSAQKSMLMAEDIARIIPKLIERGGVYNVCDDHHPSFAELEETIALQLNKKNPKSIPYFIAKGSALVGDLLGDKFPINSSKLKKMTKSLTFSNQKAKRELEWEPLDVLKNFKIK